MTWTQKIMETRFSGTISFRFTVEFNHMLTFLSKNEQVMRKSSDNCMFYKLFYFLMNHIAG